LEPFKLLNILSKLAQCYYTEKWQLLTVPCSCHAILVAVLLILGDVEVNAGPSPAAAVSASHTTDTLRLGVLDVRSATNKIALIHDIIGSYSLDLLVLTETWFSDQMPRSIADDVAPAGFSAVHCCRQSGVG